MTKKSFLLTAAFMAFTFVACEKNKDMVSATVVDTGDITYEGCGYLLQLEDKALLQPLYLPSAFQHDGMKVEVKYKHTGVQDTCEYGTIIYDLINIEKIEMAKQQ